MIITAIDKIDGDLLATVRTEFNKIDEATWMCKGTFSVKTFETVKKQLLKRFPGAKIEETHTMIGVKKYYNFVIKFEEESEEAEFIMYQEHFEIDFSEYWKKAKK